LQVEVVIAAWPGDGGFPFFFTPSPSPSSPARMTARSSGVEVGPFEQSKVDLTWINNLLSGTSWTCSAIIYKKNNTNKKNEIKLISQVLSIVIVTSHHDKTKHK
jgi:hypothetical protein